MIVSPIAAPVASSESTTQTHSPSAVERAKAAFAGVTMSRSDTPEDPLVTKTRNSVRTLKMKTQASPERYLQEIQSALPAENATNTTDGQANATMEETKPLSPQYAALARERRALQVKERELAARQKALESQAPRMDAPDLISRLKAEPLRVLEEAGVTYEQLTNAILSKPVNPEFEALKDELKSVREEFNKTLTERDSQSEQQVLAEMRKEAIELAKTGDDYGLVRETGSIRDVMTLIERTYRETGEVLDVKEAMDLVETELMKEAMKIASINKIKSTFVPQQVQPQQQQQRQMRTLTNRDTATPPMSAKARAIAAFQGVLKK